MDAHRSPVRREWSRIKDGERAAQLAEFAVALPLLIVFVVGIFDFSGAFTLKQKLTNVARDAARAAAADPFNDVGQPSAAVPASVADAYQLIDNYLVANKINECGMNAASFVFSSPSTWRYSASSNGCPGSGLTIVINRGFYFPLNGISQPPDVTCAPSTVSGQTAVIGTCVSIRYGYQWKFGRVASLLGSSPVLPGTISATAVTLNEN